MYIYIIYIIIYNINHVPIFSIHGMLNVARVWHGISNEFGFKRSLHHPFKSCRCATRRQRAAMIPMQWTVTWQPGKIWEGSGKDLGRMGRILGEFQLFVLVSRKHLLPGMVMKFMKFMKLRILPVLPQHFTAWLRRRCASWGNNETDPW
jgi:hypothetical protein